ncbi:hypothetical protein HYW42_01050 [Candidatus Daviesbacteria bacterium]|nr:hypothetical protein [Candidatus Daviesbacteria bacterium]
MDKLLFKEDELRAFITQVQIKLNLNTNQLAELVGISGRTLRDWKREKFNPQKEVLVKCSKLSQIPLPAYKTLPQFWHNKIAAKLGGKRTYELYGLLGNRKSRSKGGKISWLKRRENPELWKKYVKIFKIPEESEDLAELFGIILGDGGLTRYQCVIYLNSDTDQEFAMYVQNLIEKLFDSRPSIYKSRKDHVWQVSIGGINLVEYLNSKGLSLGNKILSQVEVPKWIWAKEGYIRACIRGLVDTDGCFTIHKYRVNNKVYAYPKLAFSNRSEPILQFMYQGLRQVGFNPKRTFKYGVWLHNQQEVRRYLQEIGTRNYKPSVKKILGGVA